MGPKDSIDVPELKPVVYTTLFLFVLGVNIFVFIILYRSEKDWEVVANFLEGYDIIVSIIGFFQRIFVDFSLGLVSIGFFSLGAIIYTLYKYIQMKDIPKNELRNGLILISIIIGVGLLLFFLMVLGIIR